jgi:hypothetical protein
MNDNQNGMVQQGRTTSRVLAPPGGQSSFSLGVAPPPKKVAPKVAAGKLGSDEYHSHAVVVVVVLL